MRKTSMAICVTAALGLCLTGPKDASASPAADAGKVYAQSVAGKSTATPVRWAGGAGRIGGVRAAGVRGVGVGYGVGWRGRAVGFRGWGARRVGLGYGVGWRRRGWGWGPGLGLGWGGYYSGWGGYGSGLGLGWGWPVGLGAGWGYGAAYPATYGGCGVSTCGCGGGLFW
jgi:hypothetical protein